MEKIIAYYKNYTYRVDIALSIALILALATHYLKLFPTLDVGILITCTFLGTLPIFVSAFQQLKAKEWASMDMLASIALFFSIVTHEWSSAVFISLMLSSSRILGDITERRTRKSIDALLKLRPEKAKVEVNGSIREIRTEEVKVGDIVVVDIGEYIPIDGIIVDGDASINESSLTGESLPVEKTVNAKASSGTFVVSGSIRIKTLLIGKDTTLEKIIALVETAQTEKPKSQALGEKFGKVYLITIFIGSFVLYLVTKDLRLILAVVLVVCADDIAVAIPLGYLRAIGSAAKHGVIVKGGKHLETLGKVDVIVFDKTGTLTTGKLKVTGIYVTEKSNEEELIRLGGVVARRSHHPLAKAVIDYVNEKGEQEVFPDEADVIEGKGVVAVYGGTEIVLGREMLMKERSIACDDSITKKAVEYEIEGKSVSYLAKNGEVIGFFAAGDTIKHDAKKAVEALFALGIKKVVMLSGDNERVAGAVAREIGITDVHANLLPEDKLNRLREFHKNHKVAMVGDGVNDAAALSISHVGIAMGALGSDSAIESAEIVLMHDNLSAIPRTIQLARDVHNISIQDFFIWAVTNGFGLVLVFSGMIGPSGAAAYNFISDFFPLLNSIRVRMK
jgi:heavy metal translocating P-type ATPase